VTVILSTHIVEDVRELCPRMAIIANGELLLEGAPAETIDELKGKIWSKVVATDDELRALETNFQLLSTHLAGGLNEVRIYSDSNPGDAFLPVASDLEDVYFLNLAGTQKTERGETNGIVLGVFLVRNKVAAEERVDLRLLWDLVPNQFSFYRRPGLSQHRQR
jgi:ABC-type multidrug transport system ATPase subunit